MSRNATPSDKQTGLKRVQSGRTEFVQSHDFGSHVLSFFDETPAVHALNRFTVRLPSSCGGNILHSGLTQFS